MVRQLGTFVVPDESTFYGIPRDFYKYEQTKLARALIRSIVPVYIRAESSPEVVMLRFVSKSGIARGVHSASVTNIEQIQNRHNFHKLSRSHLSRFLRAYEPRVVAIRLYLLKGCARLSPLGARRQCLPAAIFASRRLICFARFNGYLYSPTCPARPSFPI